MTRNKLILAALVAGGVGVGAFAFAQSHSGSMDHSTMDHSSMGHGTEHVTMDHGAMMSADASVAPVSEPGQGAFAAIAEIVAQLELDPDTDWNSVDIAGLRAHLRDMDMVFIDAVAVANEIDGGMQFTVTGAAEVAPSISRMSMAHASFTGGVNGWEFLAREIDGGAVMTVMVPPQDMVKLKALGFFGVMASDSHHQIHHWMMAAGQDPHG